MKHLIACLVLVLLVGCQPRPGPVVKVISDKMQVVEQRLDWDPWDHDNALRSRATTVFYLIADDWYRCEVKIGDYIAAKAGQEWASYRWRK